jgi:hypothetical protein
VDEYGVDTGSDYVFSIGPGGTTCPVTERSQSYGAVFGAGPVSTTSCRLAGVTGAGVRFECGGRDLLIPAAVTRSRPPAAVPARAPVPATGPGNVTDIQFGPVGSHGNLTWCCAWQRSRGEPA